MNLKSTVFYSNMFTLGFSGIMVIMWIVHKYKYRTYTITATQDNGGVANQNENDIPGNALVNENYVDIELDNI